MMQLSLNPKVFLHRKPVDFRKQINGLSLIVQDGLQLDPFAHRLCLSTEAAIASRFCIGKKRLLPLAETFER